MAIEMRCPHCDEEYSFPERRRGDKAQCGVCERGFVIGQKDREDRPRSRSGVSESRDMPPSASKYAGLNRKRDEEDDEEERRPRRGARRVRKEESWWEENLSVILVAASVVVLTAAGIGGWFWWDNQQKAEAPAFVGPPPGFPPPGFPPVDPGPFQPWPQQQPPPNIRDVRLDDLLAHLNNKPVVPGGNWGRSQIIEELGRRKEPRALPVLVPLLTDFFEHGNAVNALRAYGPSAEKELLAYLHHPDDRAREGTRTLLREFKTSSSILITQTLADLKGAEERRPHNAILWLADTPPDSARAAEVARAQEKALESKDVTLREHAMRGLVAWGSRDNTPAVAKLLTAISKDFSSNTHRHAFDAVRKWKDPRAASGLAACLGNFFLGNEASQVLKELGPEAAKEVVVQMHHPDRRIADMTRDILRQQKAPDDLLLNQTFVDLQSKELARRNQAIAWLAQAKPIDAKRAEVAKALDPLLRDPDGGVRELTLKAAKTWPHRDNVPALIVLVDDPDGGFFNRRRTEAMDILGELKDVRAAECIAGRLEHRADRIHASRTLRAIGSGAEQAVWKYLDSNDISLKFEVCRLLQDIGTKKSVPALEKAAKDPNPAVARLAKQALEAASKRE